LERFYIAKTLLLPMEYEVIIKFVAAMFLVFVVVAALGYI
jgi:hypothetical protein